MSKDSVKPRLVIIEGNDKGKVITLESGSTVIGRTKGDVILQDPRVSRSHVALNFDERSGKLSYTDLKSLNGTLVNGNPVETGVLVDGDRLQIGNTLFDCQLSAATELAEARPTAAPSKKKPKKEKERTSSLKELDEVSQTGSRGRVRKKAAAEKLEPLLEELDENREPRLSDDDDFIDEETGSTTPFPRKRNKSLIARYVKMTPMQRNLMAGIALLFGVYFFFSGGEGSPPGDFSKELQVVKALEKEGRVAEALEKGEALLATYDRDPELHATLGSLYATQKKLEPAIQAYRRAKELLPEHPTATVRLISLYLKAGLGKEAESQMEELDRMMKEGKHSRELFVEAAGLFLEHRELTRSPEKALILSRALQNELAIDSTIGYKLEAQLMFQQSQNEQALAIIEKGLKRDPQDEWLLENQAFAKLSLKDTAGAAAIVENWIRVHPEATKALLVMGYLKYNDKNFLGAVPYLQRIVQIAASRPTDPHLPEALHLMAQIFVQQGQTAEAKGLFQQSCDVGFTQACSNELLRSPAETPSPSRDDLDPISNGETVPAEPAVSPASPAVPSGE